MSCVTESLKLLTVISTCLCSLEARGRSGGALKSDTEPAHAKGRVLRFPLKGMAQKVWACFKPALLLPPELLGQQLQRLPLMQELGSPSYRLHQFKGGGF